MTPSSRRTPPIARRAAARNRPTSRRTSVNHKTRSRHHDGTRVKKTLAHHPDLLLLKKFWRDYLFHYRWHYPPIIFFMVVAGLSTAGMARLIKPTIDTGLERAANNDLSYIYLLAVGFLLASMVRGFSIFAQSIMMQRISTNIIETLRRQMFRALQTRPLQHFATDGTAHELSRFTNDVSLVVGNLGNILVSLGKDLSTLLFLFATLLSYNWLLTSFCLVLLPLSFIPIRLLGRRIRALSQQQQQQAGAMLAVLDDSLKGAKHVRAYGLEQWQEQRVNESFMQMTRTSRKAILMRAWSNPSSDIILGLVFASTLLAGAYSIMHNLMSTGSFVSYLVTLILAFAPIRGLSGLSGNINDALPAMARIFDLLTYAEKLPPLTAGRDLVIDRGTIVFDRVSFTYPDGRAVFKNFSLTIPGGKTVALVGSSGAGKSTLMNLIPRLYDATSGHIFIDGQDIKKCSLTSLRHHIALVSQEQGLFDVSIHDNILAGNLSADDTAVKIAASRAEAQHFISHLPRGFQTKAGELGNALSGGQKQRISLARAFLRNAPIILLDEVTSALDAKTEKALQKTWESLLQGRTALIIAHRLATVKRADLILVLHQGQIVEQGTHQELMAHNGLYAELAREQLSGHH